MKKLKKVMYIGMILIINNILLCCNLKNMNSIKTINTTIPVKIAILLDNYYNPYNLNIKKSLEDIQKEKKVEFNFFDGKNNPSAENEIVSNMIKDNYNLIIISVSSIDKNEFGYIEEFVNKAKEKNIPLILFNMNPANLEKIKNYQNVVVINTDSEQAGILQGKMIANAWKNNKLIDKNGDNIMQYIMLKGQRGSYIADARSNYAISTINDVGIRTQELAEVSANWDEELSENMMGSLFLKYDGNIEVIIANSDSIAIGAAKGLQKYGYNIGNKEKYISIFGIDAIPEAQELIKKGAMAGTVLQDTKELADAFYDVGMKLISGENPLEGTSYKLDKTGKIILIPFHEYINPIESINME